MAAARSLFSKGLAACFAVAFLSALTQWDGLYGPQGVSPVAEMGIPGADEQAYAVMLLGLVFAMVAVVNVELPVVPLLATLPLLYTMLLDLARTSDAPFFNFQWDILLVEAGLLGAFWGDLFDARSTEPSRAIRWALRFLAFKLMFMSGVVKITHGDKTWLSLNALDYHFASQPLPTPLAAFANAVPSSYKRWATAFSLAIEIPGSLLLLAPDRYSRMLGAAMQVWLMVNIAATGNYNFFNLLTAIIMIPVWEDRAWKFARWAEKAEMVTGFVCISGFVVLSLAMLSLDVSGNKSLADAVVLLSTPPAMRKWCTLIVPASLGWCTGMVIFDGLKDLYDAFRLRSFILVLTRLLLICVAIISVSASGVALSTLNQAKLAPPDWVVNMYQPLGRFNAGYGLFRTMTGVGNDNRVAVPVLLFEVIDANGTDWEPLDFLYYPARETSKLKWVAPHQPRLDWQLWFAALVPDARYARWVDAFAERLIQGSKPVWGLVQGGGAKPRRISAIRARVMDAKLAPPFSNTTWVFDYKGGYRQFMREIKTRSAKLPRPCTSVVCRNTSALLDVHWAVIPAMVLAVCLFLRLLGGIVTRLRMTGLR